MEKPTNSLLSPALNPATKPAAAPKSPAPKPWGAALPAAERNPTPKPPARSGASTPKVNPLTARSGVPRQVGAGERQLDGTRTPTFSQPVKKPGLAARSPAPAPKRGSSEQRSGIEHAMGALADQLHPRRRR